MRRQLLLLALLLVGMASCKYAGRAFGPQDEGGIYLIIAVKADGAQMDGAVAQTINVMQKRCNELNIYCKAERVGGGKPNQIKLRISSPKEDPERVKGVILSQGLEMRAVVSPPGQPRPQTYPTQAQAEESAGADKDVLPYPAAANGSDFRTFVVVERTPIVNGQSIIDAKAVTSALDPKMYDVTFKLNPEGGRRLGEWTGSHVEHYIAVVLNKEVRSVAMVKSQIFDEGVITSNFTREQAEDAALVLKSGNLPAPIEALEEGTYTP
ncbi:MAG TPA: hypothetical protein VJ715_05860 [Pyrinomonadaceae bacterium]|nr:hypothetical protein [Pyrinomonadaceae bacterium]